MGLAFTIVGTLVSLAPGALLATELVKNPCVFREAGAARKLLGLLCSDGKPIVAFAAAADEPVGEKLGSVRAAIRRRLWFMTRPLHRQGKKLCGSSLHHRVDDATSEQIFIHPWGDYVWKYAGVMGLLLGGQIVAAVGAAVFLFVDFSWLALLSLLSSTWAGVASTPRNARAASRESTPTLTFHNVRGGRGTGAVNLSDKHRFLAGWEIAMPGPLALLRLFLALPAWPIGLALLGLAGDGEPPSEPLWVLPSSWLSVSEMDIRRPLDWVLVQHAGSTLFAAALSAPFLFLWAVFAALFVAGMLAFLIGSLAELVVRVVSAAFWVACCRGGPCCGTDKEDRKVVRPDPCIPLSLRSSLETAPVRAEIWSMVFDSRYVYTSDLGKKYNDVLFDRENWASTKTRLRFRQGSGSWFFVCTGSKYQGLFWQWVLCHGSCGSMLSVLAGTRSSLALVITAEHVVLLVAAMATGECAGVEWAYGFAHVGWWVVMLVSEGFSAHNPFAQEVGGGASLA